MKAVFKFEGFIIKSLIFKREVLYQVFDKGLFVCRIVPAQAGYQLSNLDQTLNHELHERMLIRLSDFFEALDDGIKCRLENF